ncbi:MAG: Bax inhibitor-1/YccA family protein [Flavobacteriales bacterium]|jgi:FtsH-binding integral membrane protein|nr:Bax inhibitor-1/YccA family protein [Flavobacteriales bacterium]
MDYEKYDSYETLDGYGEVSQSDISSYMAKVFTYMFLALLASGVTAYLFGNTEGLRELLYTAEGGRTMLGWIVMFSPIGVVLLMGGRMNKMSFGALALTFFTFAILFGASISYIFFMFSDGHLFLTFFISAATFGVMALVGYTTSTDLTKMGSILYMALIGLVIAMLVNWFIGSSQMDYIISGIGVLIFTGLTAYDTQKVKHIALTMGTTSEGARKMIIMGALTLYLDFVNLFLFMLRFFGRE